jgi:hypothetical protein
VHSQEEQKMMLRVVELLVWQGQKHEYVQQKMLWKEVVGQVPPKRH